jgi:NitT/TauT family transport system substrate-binding protein
MVKESVLKSKKPQFVKLVKGWLKGSAEINGSEAAKKKAAKILASGFGSSVDEAFALGAINNVRLATYGDNLDFFGLNSNYKGVTGKDLYTKMTKVYGKLNLAKNSLSYDSVIDPSFIRSLKMDGKGMSSEVKKTFSIPTKSEKTAKVVASKPVRVVFDSGSFVLEENAKQIIDIMFVDQAKAFPSSRIRIEGNTDKTGSTIANKRISKKRAQSVVDYLVNHHKMDKNRFIVVGNGSDKPLCGESTPKCFSRNRRTDFQILAN